MSGRDFDRQLALFGKAGQDELRKATVAVVGAGGVGSHVIQQLALLGVGALTVIDAEELAETNRNRYVTARRTDPIPGSPKVSLAVRLVHEIDNTINVRTIRDSFVSSKGFEALITSDYVFGCIDSEGARFVLNELCAAYTVPYLDVASDVIPGSPIEYGGRICVCTWDIPGCLMCRGLIDFEEAQREMESSEARVDRAAIYGVEAAHLDRSGPSVVTINGVVASIAATEFMVLATGLRQAKPLQQYRGHLAKLTVSRDQPTADCYYCSEIKGKREAADLQRYINAGIGHYLR